MRGWRRGDRWDDLAREVPEDDTTRKLRELAGEWQREQDRQGDAKRSR